MPDPITGDYVDEEDRYQYLTGLVRSGVNIAPDAQGFLNEYGSRRGQVQAQTNAYVPPSNGVSNTSLGVQPGYMWEVQAREHALSKYVVDLQTQTQRDIANINASTQKEIAAKDRALQLQLQRNQISADKYMQARELAQRESQFARDLALRSLIADREHEINKANLELNRLGEIRMERELQARLAANPQDFVAYELYKRMLPPGQQFTGASPAAESQANWDLASTMAGGNATIGTVPGQQNMLGTPYEAAPPAYDDNTLATVAAGIFGQQGETEYNPALGGAGIFGSDIPSPNEFSRAQGGSMTDSELGILQSFLKAGVDMGNGKRVSIDPGEWLSQAEKSWIPTMSSIGQQVKYN